MKTIIVGAPGTNKQKIAKRLWDFYDEDYLIDPDYNHDFFDLDERTFGFLVDYREELLLAAFRSTRDDSGNMIYTHSLIDSMAYSTLRLSDSLNSATVSQIEIARWGVTFDAILSMLTDGFKADQVLYISYRGDDQDSKDLDEALKATLDKLEISHSVIDPSDEVSKWLSK